jgi:hypothetical protein
MRPGGKVVVVGFRARVAGVVTATVVVVAAFVVVDMEVGAVVRPGRAIVVGDVRVVVVLPAATVI